MKRIFPFTGKALLALALLSIGFITCLKAQTVEGSIEETGTPNSPDSPEELIPVFTYVEQMPEFKGGQTAWQEYLAKNIKYPKSAIKDKTEGTVYIQMQIDTDGQVTNAKVVKSLDPKLDAEALRVVNASPAWKPGKQNGKAVKVMITLPVRFELK